MGESRHADSRCRWIASKCPGFKGEAVAAIAGSVYKLQQSTLIKSRRHADFTISR